MRLIGTTAIFVLACLIVFLTHARRKTAQPQLSGAAHTGVCVGAFACGCAARLLFLTSLPAGISAEEALLGVQAKALWQTGGFLFSGTLSTALEQWAGNAGSILLAVITAPFVGLLGMTALSVRLPLALLSCAGMAAAYPLGRALGGRRAGRWCLVIFALCPYFVLSARVAMGVQAAICLLPIALALLCCGVRRPGLFYVGSAVLALLAYAQDLYMLISPVAIVVCAVIAALYGLKKRHALGAAALGLAICLPAALSCAGSMAGTAAQTELFGLITLSGAPRFEAGNSLFAALLQQGNRGAYLLSKMWAILEGGVFQEMTHSSIGRAMYAPEYLMVLYNLSLPLMLVGGFAMADRRVRGLRAARENRPGRALVIALSVWTYIVLVVFAREDVMSEAGTSTYFDFTALFVFTALLMAAGLCSVERRSVRGGAAMLLLMAASFFLLCVHLFGGSFAGNATMYLRGVTEASRAAAQAQRETGAAVNISCPPYQFTNAQEGTQMLYLFGADLDTQEAIAGRDTAYRTFDPYAGEADDAQIYILCCNDEHVFPAERFDRRQYGDYVLLTPKETAR